MPYQRFQQIVLVFLVALFSSILTHAWLTRNYLTALGQILLFIIIVFALYSNRLRTLIAVFLASLIFGSAHLISFPLLSQESLMIIAQNLLLYLIIGMGGSELFTQIKYALPKFEHLNVIDLKTGVWNEKFTKSLIRSQIERNKRYGNTFATVQIKLILPEKKRRKINRGLLKKVGNLLRRNIRHCDEAGMIDKNTFLLLLPETPQKGAKILVNRLKKAISNIPSYQKGNYTLSFKISHYPTDKDEVKKLIEGAE